MFIFRSIIRRSYPLAFHGYIIFTNMASKRSDKYYNITFELCRPHTTLILLGWTVMVVPLVLFTLHANQPLLNCHTELL